MIEYSPECFYCEKNSELQKKMIEITKLEHSTFYLNKDQKYYGRSILAFKRHKKEIFELTSFERKSFFDELSLVALILKQVFRPDKLNYAIYGDLVPHLHVHIVPKYKNRNDWGEAFINNPSAVTMLSDSNYNNLIQDIREGLLKKGE